MASLNSWLSAGVMQALGWTLIHSLWQCLGVAALAAALMALSRRPSVRYGIAVGALALMLAAPVVTLLALVKSNAPVAVLVPATSSVPVPSVPAGADVAAVAVPAPTTGINRIEVFKSLPRSLPAPAGLPLQSFLPWLVATWLCGVTLFSLRFAGGFLLLEHRRRSKSGALDPHILSLCHALQQQLGLNRAIGYLQCTWLEAPAVMGWIRPIVLLPVTVLTGLSEDQLRAVIAHELAHIRRLDSYVNLFQILVETLLFYHPAIWWLNRRIRAERELCCDEIVVSLTGNRLEYARALARMAEYKNVTVLAMAANRGPLAQRVLHVLGVKPAGAGQRVMGLTGGVLFLLAALAAANLLFGIAAPPMAQAKESIKTALSSIQDATGHLARQVLQISQPAPPAAAPQAAAAGQAEAANSSAEPLVPPSPDLSGLLPKENLATPTVVSSSDARIPNGQPDAAVRPAAPDGSMRFAAAAAPTEAGSGTAIAPGPKTEAGIRCLLGLEPDGCWRGFENSFARQDIIHCTGNWGVGFYPTASLGGDGTETKSCPWGPLKSIEYLGINSAGDDVYSVSFFHSNITYVLPQPGPDGRIATRCIFNGSRYGLCLGGHAVTPATATVTLPANRPRILYTRAADKADVGAANISGPKTELALACILGTTSKGCEKIFLAAVNARPLGSWPSVPSVIVRSTQFSGRNDVGDEVWDVKLQHSERTYVISPPDQDGRVQRLLTREGPPDRQCDNLVEQLFPGESHIRSSCHILEQNIGQPASVEGATAAAPSVSAIEHVVIVMMPNTPSGAGDPSAIVCRAPQHIAGGDKLGPEACGHNYEWQQLATNGKDLAPDSKTLIARSTAANPKVAIGQASAAPSATGIEPVVMPNTPSGLTGDPDTVVCRAPQHIAGSGQLGQQACSHNYEWKRLTMNGKDLAPDGKTVIDRPTVSNPKGDGDPDAVTCRTPQFVSRGPVVEVCQTNRFWADLIKGHMMVDAYGVVVMRQLGFGEFGPF